MGTGSFYGRFRYGRDLYSEREALPHDITLVANVSFQFYAVARLGMALTLEAKKYFTFYSSPSIGVSFPMDQVQTYFGVYCRSDACIGGLWQPIDPETPPWVPVPPVSNGWTPVPLSAGPWIPIGPEMRPNA